MEATKNAMQQQLSYQYSVSPQVLNAMIGEAQEDPRPCLKTCQVYPCAPWTRLQVHMLVLSAALAKTVKKMNVEVWYV
jgi:hypothetical protein